eukprot:scaffold374_cov108-Isochrysis_galbana.AAC.6
MSPAARKKEEAAEPSEQAQQSGRGAEVDPGTRPHKDTPCSVAHLYIIAWRFIITDFYQLHYDNELPPFDDEAKAYSIYTRTLERYTLLVMAATAYKIRAIIHTRERSGATHPQRLLNRTNRTIGPLFSLDAAGTPP